MAEQLFRHLDFPILFVSHALQEVETKARKRNTLASKVKSELKSLEVDVFIAELDQHMASYKRNTTEDPVYTAININKSLLRALWDTYDAAPTITQNKMKRGQKTKDELRRLWVALLAVKIYHATSHVLLNLVDSAALRLICVGKYETRCIPPKKFNGSIFNDFGNVMEIASFGGMLSVSDNWTGQDLILSTDEAWE